MTRDRGSLSSVAINKDADSLASSAVRKRGKMYSGLANEFLSLAHSWHPGFPRTSRKAADSD